jgi:hypothetical protein
MHNPGLSYFPPLIELNLLNSKYWCRFSANYGDHQMGERKCEYKDVVISVKQVVNALTDWKHLAGLAKVGTP